jgi:hypothetical protein
VTVCLRQTVILNAVKDLLLNYVPHRTTPRIRNRPA